MERKHWSNATPVRAIFKAAFGAAGLPTYPPHRIRKTLAQLGERLCRSPEEFKAWSQNLGHEHVSTTLTNYGEVAPRRQADIIRELARPKVAIESTDALAIQLAQALRTAGVVSANQ